eukprot:TRINITY_DN2430_c0_g1_i2.p1 TRINITY_DN2430_c0_g1~~TRINITY_DN2430_c0_g1_i2.p1  ORF type:complete len:154 (+),score=5.58 TRINITY_DN2430_c0_g1_i2:104-565(+)
MIRWFLILVVLGGVSCQYSHAPGIGGNPAATNGFGLGGLGALLGGLQLKMHGHYCGLNHGDGTYKTEPIDDLDRACMRHDQCYDKGYLDCNCDVLFVDELVKLQKSHPKLANTINLMSNWFHSSPCSCLVEGKRSQLDGRIDLQRKRKCVPGK